MSAPGSDDREATLVTALRGAGCVFAEDEARLLLAATGSAAELARLTARRINGEPLEYVLGWADFGGVRIALRPGVFIPRRRSELLATIGRERLDVAPGPRPLVLDLCCGSGALGLVLAQYRRIELYAVELEPTAVACATANLAGLGTVLAGDLYQPLPIGLRGRLDLVIANAPYVPREELELMPREAREYEPLITHDGGPDGLDVHRRIIAGAATWLRPDGHLIIETGRDQAPVVAGLMDRHGLPATVRQDEELAATAVVGTRSM